MEINEIIQHLMDLPQEIANAENSANEIRQAAKHFKDEAAKRELEIISSKSAKEWGSNDKERKTNQELALITDKRMKTLFHDGYTAEQELAEQEVEVSRLKNMFYAARTLSELKAAQMLSDRSIAANGNGRVMANAADLGL